MITTQDLDRVLAWMVADRLTSLDVSDGNTRIRMAVSGQFVDGRARQSEVLIRTNSSGRYLPVHPRSGEAVIQPGDQVDAGSVVGFLQNGAVLLPIISSASGRVEKLHAASGDLLGYGAQVLTLLSER